MVRRMCDRGRGYSLIELLVVLAIISMIAGVAVPTLMKAGAFSREDQSISSRLIYDMLKGAQVYASTHRTDAALVYGVDTQTDSDSGSTVRVVDVIALCRRATDAEADLLYLAGDARRDILFVPVATKAGTFRWLRDGMCIQGDIFDQADDFSSEESDAENDFGLMPVLLTDDGAILSPRPGSHYRPDGDAVLPALPSPDMYPAHIFKPSGYVDCGSAKERYVFYVGPTPESPAADRFVDPTAGTLEPLPPHRVELFRSTGRVKVSSDDDA